VFVAGGGKATVAPFRIEELSIRENLFASPFQRVCDDRDSLRLLPLALQTLQRRAGGS
jgi:hypothetical protein